MSGSQIRKVAVLGAGLMGHGIAQVCAQTAGYDVALLDVKQEFVDRGMSMIKDSLARFVSKGALDKQKADAILTKIHPTTDLEVALEGVQLVIEAATEDPKLKLGLYRRVAEYLPPGAVLASNTSSISITLLGSATKNPENVAGMHFFNPPQLMPLIEIIRGARTSDSTVETVRAAAKQMGKETVLCKKDSPGFIVNRILIPLLNDCIRVIDEAGITVEDLDTALRYGAGWPMGPAALVDLIGLDIHVHASEALHEKLAEPRMAPPARLVRMANAGKLGRKSGEGFYRY